MLIRQEEEWVEREKVLLRCSSHAYALQEIL
jgi:hypothetical protein